MIVAGPAIVTHHEHLLADGIGLPPTSAADTGSEGSDTHACTQTHALGA